MVLGRSRVALPLSCWARLGSLVLGRDTGATCSSRRTLWTSRTLGDAERIKEKAVEAVEGSEEEGGGRLSSSIHPPPPPLPLSSSPSESDSRAEGRRGRIILPLESVGDFVSSLTEEQRAALLQEIHQAQATEVKRKAEAEKTKARPPNATELRKLAVFNALPFIGFGFLDNFIMIIAGDYIDLTIGTTLGISTLAAAALGNTVSDLAGIGSAWYVENMAARTGMRPPDLTQEQLDTVSARWSANVGRGIGVVVGCLMGMFPLLFLPFQKEDKSEVEAT
ncbi:transmembrane protein 65-like isoform X2 [Penaeus chinensis]|uniref:transmembrane protein 65-like isoform X2 n=1 Tax=Penaeus chinensis TaxID=139456 RepID=UPI001FB77329|nr:transmembrane protein 65-like isoform X2 [Penaeus chinensis]